MRKPLYLLLGGTLLAVLALGGQRRSISAVQRETKEWKERIAVEQKQLPADAARPAAAAAPPDPYGIHARLRKRNTIAERRQFEAQGRQMSADDFDAALTEIQSIGEISELARVELFRSYFQLFVEVDPLRAVQAAIRLAATQIEIRHLFGQGLAKIAQTDPATACALIDELIPLYKSTAKSLNDINRDRVSLEAALIPTLHRSQPQIAKARLLAMTEGEAASVMRDWIFNGSRLPDKAPLAKVAALGREVIPEVKLLEIFGTIGEDLSHDLNEASAFLEGAAATGPEVTAAAGQVFAKRLVRLLDAKTPAVEAIDGIRTWAEKWDPSKVQTHTGHALGSAVGGYDLTFEEASKLVLHYNQRNEGDELLHTFLTEGGGNFGEDSLELAQKIRDPQVRAAVVKHITNQ